MHEPGRRKQEQRDQERAEIRKDAERDHQAADQDLHAGERHEHGGRGRAGAAGVRDHRLTFRQMADPGLHEHRDEEDPPDQIQYLHAFLLLRGIALV